MGIIINFNVYLSFSYRKVRVIIYAIVGKMIRLRPFALYASLCFPEACL